MLRVSLVFLTTPPGGTGNERRARPPAPSERYPENGKAHGPSPPPSLARNNGSTEENFSVALSILPPMCVQVVREKGNAMRRSPPQEPFCRCGNFPSLGAGDGCGGYPLR